MPKAIRIAKTGGPEVLTMVDVPVAPPGPMEVRIQQTHIGLNFIDIYHRSGVYPLTLPSGLGVEAAGNVVAVGRDVTWLSEGDRVAYAMSAPGAYAQERTLGADRLVKLPGTIDNSTAAAILLKGLTAQYLLRQTYPVKSGETILFHAAAGGTGQIACSWAKALGAKVIGTVGSESKAALAKAAGCDLVVVRDREDFVARVREWTDGRGVHVVYDGVGHATFLGSLDCLLPRGLMVTFGQSSGKIPPLDVTLLAAKGSLYLTRPSLGTYTADAKAMQAMAGDLFAAVTAGHIHRSAPLEMRLADVAEAHHDLATRKTTGQVVLIP